MTHSKLPTILLTTIILLTLISCSLRKPTPDLTGLDQPITLGQYQFQVVSAAIRTNYATHYIMHYPPPYHAFYTITADLQGFDTPKTALDWGRHNLQLMGDTGPADLVHATWTLTGEHIQYKSGQDFQYLYQFYFKVPKGIDYSQYHLQIPSNPVIQVSAILELSLVAGTDQATALPEDGTPVPGDISQPEGQFATLGGGSQNTSTAYHTTVGGGYLNTASSAYALVGGGARKCRQ